MINFWYFICILFFLNNIHILFNESYELIYRIFNQKQTVQYLDCLNLNEIIINKTKINLNEIKENIKYNLKWMQKNKRNRYGRLILNETIDKILSQIELKNYLIYRTKICFIFSNRHDLILFYRLLTELMNLNITYFLFNNDTFTFLKLTEPNFFRFNQITIQHKAYPYSNCSKNYSNFKCLNDRIKKYQLLSKYYYDSNDNGSIELNYQINQTIINNEIQTIKACNRIDCKTNFLYSFEEMSESIELKSFLNISKSDFYFQLIGLIVLFLNIPVYELIIKLTKLERCQKILVELSSRFNKLKYLKLNYLIRLIIIICLLILFNHSISNFIHERDYPSMKRVSVDSIKSELTIVICVLIKNIKGNDYNVYNRSLSDIEKDTDNALDIVLKNIYLKFLDKKISIKWQLESKLVLFNDLDRCFQLRIFLNEPKYQSIFSITKLVIEFNKYKYGNIFILTDNELFSSKSYEFSISYNFRKKILERSKLNQIKKCKNFNLEDDNCGSKWNCIDRCMSREIYNQIKNLTEYLFIEKKYFTHKEWSNLFIKSDSDYREIYSKIYKECVDKYSKLDSCIEIKFEKQSKTNNYYYLLDNKMKFIFYNYELIYLKEDEPSIFKLLLDLLNIQINLFCLNFYNCSFMILGLFKFTDLKLIKMFKLVIYLICSVGFIYHLWSIYNEIINIEIIYNEHYELINSIRTPDLIFCFNFNQTKIDPNYKLTYEYLDKITSDQLREDQIFNRIEYLNESNQWIKLDNKTNFKDHNLEIKIFYYLDRKCFKIVQNIEYNKNQFDFNDKMENDNLVFKIFLNRIYLYNKTIYFFTKSKYKFHFSKIEELYLENNNKLNKIKHQIIKIDEFELIKNPLFSNDNQNDLDKFFTEFINYFDTKLNLVTFKLPIEKTILNLGKELDDDLFIQLYNQKEDQINSKLNHLRHSHNYLEFYFENRNLYSDFRFSLSFYRKVIAVSNKISLIKLIINLLNVLSFWFDLGILDLHYYLFKIKLLPLLFYKLLTKIYVKLNLR